jgi:Uma2 family endonuclease
MKVVHAKMPQESMSTSPTTLRSDPTTQRIRWTQGAVRRLTESGLVDLEGYELLEGELIHKVKNRPHFAALRRVLAYLRGVFGDEYIQHEMPIQVTQTPTDDDETLPEPDAAVLTKPSDSLESAPLPSEVRLVIEIADSTRSRDLGEKARLYAQAGIAEYWVLDIPRRRLHVHRQPEQESWREVRQLTPDELVAPLGTSEVVAVGELLPPLRQAGDAQ